MIVQRVRIVEALFLVGAVRLPVLYLRFLGRTCTHYCSTQLLVSVAIAYAASDARFATCTFPAGLSGRIPPATFQTRFCGLLRNEDVWHTFRPKRMVSECAALTYCSAK